MRERIKEIAHQVILHALPYFSALTTYQPLFATLAHNGVDDIKRSSLPFLMTKYVFFLVLLPLQASDFVKSARPHPFAVYRQDLRL